MVKIDEITDKILRELQANARIPNVQLANRVGLSPAACLRRVQELEHNQVIKGYHATIDRTALGRAFVAYASVGMSDHSKASLDHFKKVIAKSKEVVECYKVTGTIEYLLRIEVIDIYAYEKFHSNILGAIPHVSHINSFIVMHHAKNERS